MEVAINGQTLLIMGIHVEDLKNSAVVTIQGAEFPISFTMQTMEFIADVYGGDYSQFEF